MASATDLQEAPMYKLGSGVTVRPDLGNVATFCCHSCNTPSAGPRSVFDQFHAICWHCLVNYDQDHLSRAVPDCTRCREHGMKRNEEASTEPRKRRTATTSWLAVATAETEQRRRDAASSMLALTTTKRSARDAELHEPCRKGHVTHSIRPRTFIGHCVICTWIQSAAEGVAYRPPATRTGLQLTAVGHLVCQDHVASCIMCGMSFPYSETVGGCLFSSVQDSSLLRCYQCTIKIMDSYCRDPMPDIYG